MMTQALLTGALVALVFSGIGSARSQEALQPMQITAAAEGITVQGHGEIKLKPDIALLTLTVTTQSAEQAEAVRNNAARTTAVLTALRGAGIAAKDIQTQSYMVQPQYDYKPSPPLLTGYQVQNSVQATVRDLTKVGLVIDNVTAVRSGSAEVGGVSFDLSNRSVAEAQALSQAVASAKRKAGIMAEAAGVGLGRLLTMTEGSLAPPIRPVYAMRSMAAAPSVETPIADQQITVSAETTLVYAMGAAK